MKNLLKILKQKGFKIKEFDEGYDILYDSELVATIDDNYNYEIFINKNNIEKLLRENI